MKRTEQGKRLKNKVLLNTNADREKNKANSFVKGMNQEKIRLNREAKGLVNNETRRLNANKGKMNRLAQTEVNNKKRLKKRNTQIEINASKADVNRDAQMNINAINANMRKTQKQINYRNVERKANEAETQVLIGKQKNKSNKATAFGEAEKVITNEEKKRLTDEESVRNLKRNLQIARRTKNTKKIKKITENIAERKKILERKKKIEGGKLPKKNSGPK